MGEDRVQEQVDKLKLLSDEAGLTDSERLLGGLEELFRRIDVAVKALKFYADADNHTSAAPSNFCSVRADGGQKARDALGLFE